MKKFLHHLRHFLVPHESNNHRPKLLHEQTLLVLVLFITASTFLLKTVHQTYPEVLGIATDISNQELLRLTNEKRAEEGLKPLKLNDELSNAADEKAKFMFAKNFWAHIGPDGTTPWFFIKNAGYEYMYAGENLARGYTTAPEVVDAWMASPSHRENIMSPNYSDIGFAVGTGSLTGSETALVVQMFGTESASDGQQNVATNASGSGTPQATTETPDVEPIIVAQGEIASVKSEPLIDSKSLTQQFAFFFLIFLIGVLIVDAIIIERKQIVRLVAHNTDHIAFLVTILFAIFLIERGLIL